MSRFEPPEVVEPTLPRIYYEGSCQTWWIEDARANWMKINESAVKRELKEAGFDPKSEHGANSEVDRAIRSLQRENHVLYAGALAGYDRGPSEMHGNPILVTQSPTIIEPVDGEWTMLESIIHRIFREDDVYFYAWLAMAYQALYLRSHKPGQILVLAGPTNSGKTFLQNFLITEVLGGRSQSPYRYMTGGTQFNSDFFATEHLLIGDEVAGTDIRTRMHFGKELKKVAAERIHSCHKKGADAIPMTPFWRASISLNPDGENLMVLPPIGQSLEDKIILLEANPGPMPMPTKSGVEEEMFRDACRAELPGFCYWLLNLEVPEDMVDARGDLMADSRYGVRGYQNQELRALLEQHSPEEKLWEIIEHVLSEKKDRVWEGTTQALETELMDAGDAARKLLYFSSACGMYMARLHEKWPHLVERPRTRGYWKINLKGVNTPPTPTSHELG